MPTYHKTRITRPCCAGKRRKRGQGRVCGFTYDVGRNVCINAREDLTYRSNRDQRDVQVRRYRNNGGQTCLNKSCCTTGAERITRWEREDLLDAARQRLDRDPEATSLDSRASVRHETPGQGTPFLMRRLRSVRSGMAVQVLACNIERMVALIGISRLVQALQARSSLSGSMPPAHSPQPCGRTTGYLRAMAHLF